LRLGQPSPGTLQDRARLGSLSVELIRRITSAGRPQQILAKKMLLEEQEPSGVGQLAAMPQRAHLHAPSEDRRTASKGDLLEEEREHIEILNLDRPTAAGSLRHACMAEEECGLVSAGGSHFTSCHGASTTFPDVTFASKAPREFNVSSSLPNHA